MTTQPEPVKAEYIYDHSKRMWFRHASTCCDTSLEQKMLYNGKPVKEDFKLQTSTKVPIKETVYRKWWQLWKPKSRVIVTGQKIVTGYKKVQFRYFCNNCGKQDRGVLSARSKSPKLAHAGSTPATPARTTGWKNQ